MAVGRGIVFDLRADPERAGGCLRLPIPARADGEVLQEYVLLRIEIHRAVDPQLHPVVLVFDVALRAPAHAQHRERVAARAQRLREVELRGEARIRRHADERAVEVDPRLRLGGAEVQHRAALLPRLRQVEGRAQDGAGIFVRHARRIVLERHLHVRVVRVREALHAEVPRHRDARPLREVGLVRDFGGLHLLDRLVVGHGPLPVEIQIPLALARIARKGGLLRGERHERRAAAKAVHGSEFGDFPRAGKESRVHGGGCG